MYKSPDIFQVDKIVDGDTFWVFNHAGQKLKVRLIGIDAPETRNVFKKKKHAFGLASKNYLDNILKQNPYIKLTFDVDSLDQYGRTLAYAYLSDGSMINEQLIRNGYAVLMTVSPNIRFEKIFYESQMAARKNKRGIWK
ncbi:thermonuclease family protein [Sphingobacterium olei]|uniref:Thermonuclease family protein n=2 Tax=Sphingobacterium olei TaxID=2571155 RepID=A0A4U0PKS4_9SPHI|nr:thermonuclease family protein [Sphingobacterium olei]